MALNARGGARERATGEVEVENLPVRARGQPGFIVACALAQTAAPRFGMAFADARPFPIAALEAFRLTHLRSLTEIDLLQSLALAVIARAGAHQALLKALLAKTRPRCHQGRVRRWRPRQALCAAWAFCSTMGLSGRG